jgi:RNA polymerase sigma factor (sigma-70 family)
MDDPGGNSFRRRIRASHVSRVVLCEAHSSVLAQESWRVDLAAHEDALAAAARFLCRNDQEREDLVQDTFERALRYLAAGNPRPVHLRAWLVSILRNAFIDRRRKAKVELVELVDPPAVEPDPAPVWGAVSLDEVRAALATLDGDLRTVFELHYLDRLRYSDIATRLGIPANTIATRLYRARKLLRERLSPELP